jgi:hypothetical protein
LIKETKKKEKYRKVRNIENQLPQPASDFSMNWEQMDRILSRMFDAQIGSQFLRLPQELTPPIIYPWDQVISSILSAYIVGGREERNAHYVSELSNSITLNL